jgi:hypothetical protein
MAGVARLSRSEAQVPSGGRSALRPLLEGDTGGGGRRIVPAVPGSPRDLPGATAEASR